MCAYFRRSVRSSSLHGYVVLVLSASSQDYSTALRGTLWAAAMVRELVEQVAADVTVEDSLVFVALIDAVTLSCWALLSGCHAGSVRVHAKYFTRLSFGNNSLKKIIRSALYSLLR